MLTASYFTPKFNQEKQNIINALDVYSKALTKVYNDYCTKTKTDDTAWDAAFTLQYMRETNNRLFWLLHALESDEQSLNAFTQLLLTIESPPERDVNAFFQELSQQILTNDALSSLLKFYEGAPLTTNETVWKYLMLGLNASRIFMGAYLLISFYCLYFQW
jgi:hypothetical protein